MAQEQLPEYQKSEQVKGGVASGDFIGEFAAIAASTNQLGELGADIAQKASMQLNEKMGYEAGLDPKGNVFAGFGKSAEAYKASYNASAQSTLALQGHKALLDSQVEMLSLNRLSQENIDQYTANNSEMISDLLQNAPNEIKGHLGLQLHESLINSSSKLQIKLANQQHKDTVAKANAYNNTTVAQIYDIAFSNNENAIESAKKLTEEFISHNESNREAFIIDDKQLASLTSQAKISLWSGILSKQAVDALNDPSGEKIAPFLDSLSTQNIEGLNLSEQQSVKEAVLKKVKFDQSLKNQNQQVIYQDKLQQVKNGTLTSDSYLDASVRLKPELFSKFKTAAFNKAAKTQKKEERVNSAIKDINSSNFANYTPSEKNAAFNQLIEKQMKENPNQSKLDATADILSHSAGGVPEITHSVNQSFLTANADEVNSNIRLIDAIGPEHAANLPLGVREAAIKTMYKAEVGAKDINKTDQEVLDEVRRIITNKSNDEIAALNEGYRQHISLSYPKTSDKQGLVHTLFGLGGFFGRDSTQIFNFVGSSKRALSLYEANWKMFNGNSALTLTHTQEQLSQAYGDTTVNGEKSFQYLPVNKVMQIPEAATPVIQADIANQLEAQIAPTNEAFKKGNNEFYYEISNKPDLNTIVAQRIILNGLSARTPANAEEARKMLIEWQKAEGIIRKSLSTGPAKLTKIYRNGAKVEYSIAVVASSLIGVAADNANDSIGDWEIKGIDKDGVLSTINGINKLQTGNAFYRPHKDALQRDAAAILPVNPSESHESFKERVRKALEEEMKRKETRKSFRETIKAIAENPPLFNKRVIK